MMTIEARSGNAEQVEGTCEFVEVTYMTGAELNVDGGLLAG